MTAQEKENQYIKTYARTNDPYLDRRMVEDRRQMYTPAYFDKRGIERRYGKERREKAERRKGYIRVSNWSSVCISVDQ